MKKVGLIALICGIALIIIAFIYPSIKKGDKNENINNTGKNDNDKKLDWDIIIGSEFETNNSKYEKNDFIIESFNNSQDGNSSIHFAVPSDEELHMIGSSDIEYVGQLNITYLANENVDSMDSLIEKYLKQYENTYENLSVSKKIINDSTSAYHIKYLDEDNNDYMEDLIICYGNNNKYSYVKYHISKESLSNNVINKIVSDFKVKDSKTTFNNCQNNNGQYNCKIQINTMKKTITYTVDATKYHINNKDVTSDYVTKFDDNNNTVTVALILEDNVSEYIKKNKLFAFTTATPVTINGQNIDKYAFDDKNANYIIKLDNKIAVMLTISSTNNQLEEIAKDFVNYSLS